MKRFWTVVLCAGILCSVWGAEKKSANIKWESDVASAQQSLKGKKKSILLFFTAPGWCGPCRKLERGPLASAEFARIAQKNAAVRVDFSDNKKVTPQMQALAKEFKINGFPTMVVLDANGKEKGRIVGYAPQKTFMNRLKKFVK